jgi:hypothetical protein
MFVMPHARTGRRVSRTGNEIDEYGDRVNGIGVVYTRW